MRKPQRPYYLPATKLAQMGECQLRLVLEDRYGDMTTKAQRDAREAGVRAHADFHRRVVQHHNRREDASGRDTRCFIATQVFGTTDPRTERLRRFRDEKLMTCGTGRLFVRSYYRWSPSVASLLGAHPRMGHAVAWGLEQFIAWLEGGDRPCSRS